MALRNISILAVLGIFLCVGFSRAQPAGTGRTLLEKAGTDLAAGEYALARLKLQDILRSAGNGPVAEAQLLMSAALYGLQDFPAARDVASDFLRKYPDHSQKAYAEFYHARALYRCGNTGPALERFVALLGDTPDSDLRGRILAFFNELPASMAVAPDAGKLLKRYRVTDADKSTKRRGAGALGLICPLTGDYAEVGEHLLNGAVMAVNEYNAKNRKKLSLIVEDSRGELILAVKAARKLAEEDGVLAIAGPMLSNTTIVAAALAECMDVPLVSPTAWEHGIASIGNNVFQANVPGQVQGALIAEHAIKTLGCRTFAILAPFDSYGRSLARGFEDEVTASGATVVSREWYYEGAMDYTRQFERIRRRELIKTLNLIEVDENTDVEALARGEEESEKTLVPIPSIDAIFIPAYPEEIPMLASQVAFFNIETKILGGDRWNDESIYKEKRYVEGAIFPGIIVKRRNSSLFREFTNTFRRTYKTAPDDVALLGYDGMRLLVSALEDGAGSRKEIREYLSGLETFEGITRTLEFPPGKRYNSHLDFLTLTDGRIVPWAKDTGK